MPIKDIVSLVWKELVLNISESQALRTRQKALKMIQGTVSDQYPKLWNMLRN